VVALFPWSSLPKVERRALPALTALARWVDVRAAPGGARVDALGGAVARVEHAAILGGEALAERLADPTAAVAALRGAGGVAYVVAPGQLVRRAAQRLLGGPDEIAGPRPLTGAERAVLVYAVASWIDRLDAALEVEPSELAGPLVAKRLGEALVIDVVVELAQTRGERGARLAIVAAPSMVATPPRLALGALLAGRGARLALDVLVPVVTATTRLDREALAGLEVRDVVVVDRVGAPGAVRLAIGRGGVPATLARGDGRLTVTGAYQRGPMNGPSEHLAEDATLDVAIVVGELRVAARALLELAPGQVLSLGAPVGAGVELRAGGRVVGRGELVDVDGEVGVRILAVNDRG
jgi:flagellar motor switch/type III secretory pathway protein FliN